jgi:hypothetical protein
LKETWAPPSTQHSFLALFFLFLIIVTIFTIIATGS